MFEAALTAKESKMSSRKIFGAKVWTFYCPFQDEKYLTGRKLVSQKRPNIWTRYWAHHQAVS